MNNLAAAKRALQSAGLIPEVLDTDELVIVCEGIGVDAGACAEPLVAIRTEREALGILRAFAALEGHPNLLVAASGEDKRTAPVRARAAETRLAECGMVDDADFLASTGSIVANSGSQGLPEPTIVEAVRAAGTLLGFYVSVNAEAERPALYLVSNN